MQDIKDRFSVLLRDTPDNGFSNYERFRFASKKAGITYILLLECETRTSYVLAKLGKRPKHSSMSVNISADAAFGPSTTSGVITSQMAAVDTKG